LLAWRAWKTRLRGCGSSSSKWNRNVRPGAVGQKGHQLHLRMEEEEEEEEEEEKEEEEEVVVVVEEEEECV